MNLPIKIDWTLNVTHLVTVIAFVFTAVGAWYNLKQEVAVNKATTEQKLIQVEGNISEIKKSTDEIKGDLRTLRDTVAPLPSRR
jgi:hypothetical protein